MIRYTIKLRMRARLSVLLVLMAIGPAVLFKLCRGIQVKMTFLIHHQ